MCFLSTFIDEKDILRLQYFFFKANVIVPISFPNCFLSLKSALNHFYTVDLSLKFIFVSRTF